MTTNLDLIGKKLIHLQRMRGYLDYSARHIQSALPIQDWQALTEPQHEALAAFRVRFSEYQEHIGKLMRAVTREEEHEVEPFSQVLVYMEKLGVLPSVTRWKELRELRNAINHDYEDDTARLSAFFVALHTAVSELTAMHTALAQFCARTYQIAQQANP